MSHTWIVDVLTDLQTYARQNRMPDLAQQVEQTLRVARAEIARQENPQA